MNDLLHTWIYVESEIDAMSLGDTSIIHMEGCNIPAMRHIHIGDLLT